MKLLSFFETKKILEKYKIPILETYFLEKIDDFKKVKISPPWVIKLSGIPHRTEKKAVFLKVKEKNLKEVLKKIFSLKEKLKAEGVLVQRYFEGIELFLGGKEDKIFGKILLFGLGGIFVEVLKDISYGICPLSKKEAQDMIKNLKGYKILKGYRKKEGVSEKKLQKILLSFSRLLEKEKEIKEVDLNPLLGKGKEIFAADFKIWI